MPIRAEFIKVDGTALHLGDPEEKDSPDVRDLFLWIDDDPLERRIIVARSMVQDMGAVVHLLHEGDPEILAIEGETYQVLLNEDNLHAKIGPGYSYPVEVTQLEGQAGTLVIQHITPWGTVNSNS